MSGLEPAYYSSMKGLNTPSSTLGRERNYPAGEREALAMVWAVQKVHRFLYGQHFVLETDHRPLQYLNSAHSKSPRLMRWSLALRPYHFTIRYIRAMPTILVVVVLRTQNRHSVRHILLQMCWSTILMDCFWCYCICSIALSFHVCYELFSLTDCYRIDCLFLWNVL